MKKVVFILCLGLILISQKGFCETVQSTKTQAANDVIKLDIPALQVNTHTTPKTVTSDSTYVDTLISPAREDKPILNFNLNNIKNIKKGAILPKENIEQNLSDIVQYYNSPYDKVFSHLLGIVDSSEFEVVSYDSKTGKIFANYNHEKPVYITVSQYNSINVMVKITPADGIYDIPANAISKIFSELNKSLVAK